MPLEVVTRRNPEAVDARRWRLVFMSLTTLAMILVAARLTTADSPDAPIGWVVVAVLAMAFAWDVARRPG